MNKHSYDTVHLKFKVNRKCYAEIKFGNILMKSDLNLQIKMFRFEFLNIQLINPILCFILDKKRNFRPNADKNILVSGPNFHDSESDPPDIMLNCKYFDFEIKIYGKRNKTVSNDTFPCQNALEIP